MDVVLVTEQMLSTIPAGSGALVCPKCKNAIRAGQYVLRDRLRSAAFADTTRLVHINPCLRDLVEAAPVTDEVKPLGLTARLDRLRREHLEALAS